MRQKTYSTVKELVYKDLEQYSISQVQSISQLTIDKYFTGLVQSKAHLCAKPLKLGTVNRYVEQFLSTKNTAN